VIPVFVLDEGAMGDRAYGGASRWWLHHSLVSLRQGLRRLGSDLILRRGPWQQVLPDLARQTGAMAVHAGRMLEPWARRADAAVAEALRAEGVAIHGHDVALLHDPRTVRTRSDGPFAVYTPFSRAVLATVSPARPSDAPGALTAPALWPKGDALESWNLLPTAPDWAGGLRETWQPGEAGAARRLDRFLAEALAGYDRTRNSPGIAGTSMLSPHLRWGEISPHRR